MNDLLSRITGALLRDIRKGKGLTLRDVSQHSGEAFRPNALAAWERGERHLSLERFCHLADLYEVPAERLLGEVLRRCEQRPPMEIDVEALDRLPGAIGEAARNLVNQVVDLRGERASRVTLRAGDLRVLSTTLKLREDTLRTSIEEALAKGET